MIKYSKKSMMSIIYIQKKVFVYDDLKVCSWLRIVIPYGS
jgi:hypothetical protein